MNIKVYYTDSSDFVKTKNFLEFDELSGIEYMTVLGYLHQYFCDITTRLNQYSNSMVLNYGFDKIKNFGKNKNKLFDFYKPNAVILNLLFSGNAAIHKMNIDICRKTIKEEKQRVYDQIAGNFLETYATLSIVDNMLKVLLSLEDVQFFSIYMEEMELELTSNGIEYPNFQDNIGTYNLSWIFDEYVSKFLNGM